MTQHFLRIKLLKLQQLHVRQKRRREDIKERALCGGGEREREGVMTTERVLGESVRECERDTERQRDGV